MHPRPTTRRLRQAGLALAALAVLLATRQPGRAADPQPYTVALAPTGEAALDRALTAASSLIALRETAPVGPFPLLARARGDAGRMERVLHGLGYYAATVRIGIAGHRADDPALLGLLDAARGPVAITVAVTPGPLFHLGRITTTGDLPAGFAARLGLEAGAPAVASEVLEGGARLLAALRDAGHALARVSPPTATLDPARHTLDVNFAVAAGPVVALGPIGISGLTRLHDDYVRRRMDLREGERYSPAAIARARADLAATGLFREIRVEPASALDRAGRLPVAVVAKERKLRTVSLGAGFSTDEGAGLNAGWTHRDLWGEAEKLTLSAAVTGLGGTAARQPGYHAGAALTLPDWRRRDQSLTFNLAAFREYLDAYDRTGVTGGATLARKLSPFLTASGGLGAIVEEVSQQGMRNTYRMLQLPLKLTFDSTTSLLDPTSGSRASLTLTPSVSLANGSSSLFLTGQAAASTYLDLSGDGRSVLALRALVGLVQGAGVFGIPPDQRFYAGGSATIRGFRFQSLGRLFPDARPVGGTAIDTASAEYRQRIGAAWGAVAFVDGGQIGDDGVPFSGRAHVGVGVGVRYYTAIGPIRVDVAVPLSRERKGDAFEVYIGLGQAF